MKTVPSASAELVERRQGQTVHRTGLRRWGGRAGIAAFLFFLFKGIAWLVVPATLAVAASR